MSDYQRAIIGIAELSATNAPAAVVREQARIAAGTAVNKRLKYFGFARLVPQADILPEDQVLIKNSDDLTVMKLWWQKCNADPQMIWVGVFDNATKAIMFDSAGKAINNTSLEIGPVTVTPVKSGGSKAGLILGGLAAVVGVFAISRKKG